MKNVSPPLDAYIERPPAGGPLYSGRPGVWATRPIATGAATRVAAVGALILTAGLAMTSGFAFAQVAPAPARAGSQAMSGGSASMGRLLATQGATGVAACIGCHGAMGEGNAAAGFPRISGQAQTYLARQLAAYASGERDNPIMTPIAKAMTPEQRQAAASYYAAMAPGGGASAPGAPAPAAPTAAATPAAGAVDSTGISRGRVLAQQGDESKTVQACANCHGPQGIGEWAQYPYLGGQHASYLSSVLGEWKSGARNTDPSGQMPSIAKALSDDDVKAVSAYYASVPAPSSSVDRGRLEGSTMRRSAETTSRPVRTIVSGPTKPVTGQGVGTEQGGALTGSTTSNGSLGNPNGAGGSK
ncbi:MAG: hypothetical protein JWQ11_275 [Rhizobacter sp.]|nr:hypothetical protein [Rhizobacter sp.]